MAPSSRALDFVASYRDAFARKDPEAIVAHFSEPMLVYSEGNKVIFQNRQLALVAVKELLSVYEKLGMADAETTAIRTVLREDCVEEILLDWTLYGNNKEELVSFKTSYTLIPDQDRIVCVFAVSHNEMTEIRKYLSGNGRER
jgi:hypothetical protein